ncbi:MAG: Cna B-type domain-containing protein [Lachnospiraceae bacterium]|nr:Cna B-type domain-containing protein [Lachnospiraceae bacterium]
MNRMKRNKGKQLLSMLLAALMVCSMLPVEALAAIRVQAEEETPEPVSETPAYTYTIRGTESAELDVDADNGFNAMGGVTLTVTDASDTSVTDHGCSVGISEVKKYVNGSVDETFVWDKNPVLSVADPAVKYEVTYQAYDKDSQPVGTPVQRSLYIPGPLKYEILTGGDKSVVLNDSANAMDGVYAKVTTDTQGTNWDVTAELGYSVVVSGVKKYNGTDEDAGYSWEGSLNLDTDVVGTAWKVTYQLQKNGDPVMVTDTETGSQKAFTAEKTFTIIVGNDIRPELDSDDEYITQTRVETSTGTAPFDFNEDGTENNTPGNDGSADNLIVRSFDSFTYKVYVNSANYTKDVSYEKGYIWYRFVLPVSSDLAEFDTGSMLWMSTETGYEWSVIEETVDGITRQVLTCARLLTTEGSAAMNALPCTEASANIVIRVKGMANGYIIQPQGWAWMDHNDIVEKDPSHVCADPSHQAAANEGKEMAAFDLPAVTVSAAPMYNVTIVKDGYKTVYSSFDFNTGDPAKANNYGIGPVEGQLRGIGIYLSLCNDPADKGFRGIELPDETKDIEFDIKLSAVYSGDSTATVTPLVWTVDANKQNSYVSSFDGRAKDVGASSYYCVNVPFDRGTPAANDFYCYQSGTWSAVQTGDTVHFTVSGYHVNMDQLPTHRSGGTALPNGADVFWGAFSAGKMEFVIPNTTDAGVYLPDIYGVGDMITTVYDVNLEAVSISNQTTDSILGREQTIYDEKDGVLKAGEDKLVQNFPLYAGDGSFTQRIWYSTNIYSGDFNGRSNTTAGSCYYNGEDVGMPGQEGTIDWQIIWGAGGSVKNNLYAADSLMVFDASGLDVLDKPIKHGGQNAGKGANYQVTFRYAAKPDGTNWTGIEEMNGTDIEDLVYYDTLAALQADGKLCVGCLMQVRAIRFVNNAADNCSITGCLPVRLKTTEDILDKVYPTIIRTNMWWKSGTDRYTTEKLGDDAVNDDLTSTGKKIPFVNQPGYEDALVYAALKNYRYRSMDYEPSYYQEGAYAGGHIPSGYTNGDSLYVIPYISTIGKFVDQVVTDKGIVKQKENFNLDYGQSVVDFRLEPALEVKQTTAAGGITNVTVTETLPAGVSYNGDATLGGVYVPDPKGGHGTLTDDGTLVNLSVGGKYNDMTCLPVVVGTNSAGQTTLTFTFENVPYGKVITTVPGIIRYSCTIDSYHAVNNQQFTSSATIEASWDHRTIHVSNRNIASAGFKVSKLDSLSALKTADNIFAENGKPIGYTIYINNTNPTNASTTQIMMDTMPKPASGSYTLEDMYLQMTQGTGYLHFKFYYTTDPAALDHTAADYYADGLPDTDQFSAAQDDFGIAWTEKTAYDALPKNTTAWCLVGALPAGAVLEAKVTILPTGAEPGTAFTNNFSMGSIITRDSAYIVRRSLSGYTWLDDNKDGIMDSDEAILPGVTATLYKVNEYGVVSSVPYVNLKKSTCKVQTDDEGYYEFTDLEEGSYVVRFTSGSTVLEKRYILTTQISNGSLNTRYTSKAACASTDSTGTYVKTAEITGISLPSTDKLSVSVYNWPNMNAGFYDSISIPVEKVWDDCDNVDQLRPLDITVQLMADGTDVPGATLTLTADDDPAKDWKGVFEDLPGSRGGKDIVYTVREINVRGYETTITGSADEGFTITNTHEHEYAPVSMPLGVEKKITGSTQAASAETSHSDTSPADTSPSGTSPSGTSSSGTSPSGTSPSGTSPSETSPSEKAFVAMDFEFVLEPQDGAPVPVKNGSSCTKVTLTSAGTDTFGTIQFTKPGTYVYKITEVDKSTQQGYEDYTFDKKVVTLTVVVGLDDGYDCKIESVTGGSTVVVADDTATPKFLQPTENRNSQLRSSS